MSLFKAVSCRIYVDKPIYGNWETDHKSVCWLSNNLTWHHFPNGGPCELYLNPTFFEKLLTQSDLYLIWKLSKSVEILVLVQVSHVLFHRVVNSFFKAISLKLASRKIRKLIVGRLQKDVLWDLEDLLAAAEDEEAVGKLIASKIVGSVF